MAPPTTRQAPIETAHRLHDRVTDELLLIDGWDDGGVVAGPPGGFSVYIENALSAARYTPVRLPELE